MLCRHTSAVLVAPRRDRARPDGADTEGGADAGTAAGTAAAPKSRIGHAGARAIGGEGAKATSRLPCLASHAGRRRSRRVERGEVELVRKRQIDHGTDDPFDACVTLLPHRLLLRPRESHGLRIASSTLSISGPRPSGGVVTGSEHGAVAVAGHPESVPPVSGSDVGATRERPTLQVSVRVVAL